MDPKEFAREWSKIQEKSRSKDGKLEVLRKSVPGNQLPRVRGRRASQKGYRKWACGLWEGVGPEVEKQEQPNNEAKTWQQILDELQDTELSTPPGFEILQETVKQSAILQSLKILGTVEPEGLNALEDAEWEEVEFAVDSGATETVIGEDVLKSVTKIEGAAYKRGVKYEVANGVRIPNLGEKRFIGYSEDGQSREITAQVCDVNKPLLSVSKIVNAGNRVVFDGDGGYIEDLQSGERIWMRPQGGMYHIKMWVQRSF